MSKMAELALEIEDMYLGELRLNILEIAKRIGLSPEDVTAYIDEMREYDKCDPLSDESWDGFNSDAEADADALASAGWGTDEDYGCSAEDML